MTIAKIILVSCCISIGSAAFAQIDADPDGIGVYFDQGATQVAVTVPVGESVDAYLIATNPSQTGTLALWEASVGPSGPGYIVGEPYNGFNMLTNMPGSGHVSFAVGMDVPNPDLESITILAVLEITVLEEGPVGIFVGGWSYDWPYYRPNDFYHGPDTTLYPSSGSSSFPVAMINGAAPVAIDEQSWGGVKSLFR